MKKRNLAALLLTSAMLLEGCGSAVSEEAEYPAEEEQESTAEAIDPASIRPQDDFNGYVNAKELSEIDLDEYEGSYGSFEQISEKVEGQLDTVIDEIITGDRDSYAPGSNEQIIYDAYYQLLEASTGGEFMNEEDIADMHATVEAIQNTTSIEEFLEVSLQLNQNWNVNPVFGVAVDTDMHNSSVGSIWIQPFTLPTGGNMRDICIGGYSAQAVATGFRSTLINYGMDAETAQERSVADAKMLIDIALGTDLDLVELINKDWAVAMQTAIYKTNAEIDALCPNIGAAGILSTMGLTESQTDGMYLWDAGQLTVIDSMLTEEHLAEWQDIAVLSYLGTIAEMVPEEWGGSPVLYSNDKYARDTVKRMYSREMGEEYVERYFDPQAAEAVTQITQDIVDEYVVMVNECEWMSDTGKEAIIAKLQNMEYYIGADEPHIVDPKDAEMIGHSVYDSRHQLSMQRYEEQLKTLTDGMDRNGFANMVPQMVNACYVPDSNVINITVAIMNAPFYSPEQSYWENLGGIGAVVGHEISHGFDNNGMQYDKDGNYNPEWIPESDRQAFDEMAARVEAYYNNQTILEVHPVDGKLTLGENLADISGVDCILRLTKNNDQRKELLENYARVWASISPKDSVLAQLYMNEHNPDIVRVNAVVALFEPFYEIYDVQEGDPMYVAPQDRVTRW